jgi:hypothetical protein
MTKLTRREGEERGGDKGTLAEEKPITEHRNAETGSVETAGDRTSRDDGLTCSVPCLNIEDTPRGISSISASSLTDSLLRRSACAHAELSVVARC